MCWVAVCLPAVLITPPCFLRNPQGMSSIEMRNAKELFKNWGISEESAEMWKSSSPLPHPFFRHSFKLWGLLEEYLRNEISQKLPKSSQYPWNILGNFSQVILKITDTLNLHKYIQMAWLWKCRGSAMAPQPSAYDMSSAVCCVLLPPLLWIETNYSSVIRNRINCIHHSYL